MYGKPIFGAFCLTVYINFAVDGYEKTLRKIVRHQSKMEQLPLSQNSGLSLAWNNSSLGKYTEDIILPGYSQMRKVFHKMPKSKIPTLLAKVDTTKIKAAYSNRKVSSEGIPHFNDLRLARNTMMNSSINFKNSINSIFFPDITNDSNSDLITIDNYYEIPDQIKDLPRINQNNIQSTEYRTIKKDDDTIKFVNKCLNENITFIKQTTVSTTDTEKKLDIESYRITDDYTLDRVSPEIQPFYKYKLTNSLACTAVKEIEADINTQEKFAKFNIEPSWVKKKTFWNHVYENRYETLMKNPKWPSLQVILVPRSHVDTTWRNSFDQYHNELARKIISNVVKKLTFYQNCTFTWNDVSHLSIWWKKASQKNKSVFRKLLKSGRLEITTGGWVEPDEATTSLFELVHQLVEGHQWLKEHLKYFPKTGWLTNTVSHSPTMVYLLSDVDIMHVVFTHLHYSWEQYLAEYQYSDFIWVQNWDSQKSESPLNDALKKMGNDRYPKHSVLMHFLQFNSPTFEACGPNKSLCIEEFNFAKANKTSQINSYNVKEKSELLLEQYSKTGTISSHNTIVAPIGGPNCYESQTEFDYQYNNYKKIADFVNFNTDIYKAIIRFGTPKDYFSSILEKQISYPSLKGDFINFADIKSGKPTYWTGFYTSRPLLKILLKRLQSTLRSAEILLTFTFMMNRSRSYMSKLFELLIKARENVARLSDRNVVIGTLNYKSLRNIHSSILATVKDCWHIQEVAASLLSVEANQDVPYLQKYVYRDGEFISTFKIVLPGDKIYFFNSLSQERTEVVELITRLPNIRILNHNKKVMTIQINPVWRYTSDNLIKISRNFYKIFFVIVIPPLTLELYTIKEDHDASLSVATIYCFRCVIEDAVGNQMSPFNILPTQAGDVQLESYKLRLIFDEQSGFLTTVHEKDTNIKKEVHINFNAFKSAGKDSGTFLYRFNTSKPLQNILKPFRTGTKSKVIIIISGSVSTEMTTVYGRLLHNTVRILNIMHSSLSNLIFVETRVDYELLPNNKELELFLSIQTDLSNGNPPVIYTDNNGVVYTARFLNITRTVESNLYPITNMAFMQDNKSRLTLITDHAQGVTALQEGQLIIFIDRTMFYDDDRGTNNGLVDSSSTIHRHVILLENLAERPNLREYPSSSELILPSLVATNWANSINYLLDVFIVKKNQSHMHDFSFLPLVKNGFPCDVSLLNYRLILNSSALSNYIPNSALMILHRQGISCQIDYSAHYECSADVSFSLDNILSNVKSVYTTNLVGTRKRSEISIYTKVNFPPLELMTLKIFF